MINHGRLSVLVHTYYNNVLRDSKHHTRVVYEDKYGKFINWSGKRYLEPNGSLIYKIQEIQSESIDDILKRAAGMPITIIPIR